MKMEAEAVGHDHLIKHYSGGMPGHFRGVEFSRALKELRGSFHHQANTWRKDQHSNGWSLNCEEVLQNDYDRVK